MGNGFLEGNLRSLDNFIDMRRFNDLFKALTKFAFYFTKSSVLLLQIPNTVQKRRMRIMHKYIGFMWS